MHPLGNILSWYSHSCHESAPARSSQDTKAGKCKYSNWLPRIYSHLIWSRGTRFDIWQRTSKKVGTLRDASQPGTIYWRYWVVKETRCKYSQCCCAVPIIWPHAARRCMFYIRCALAWDVTYLPCCKACTSASPVHGHCDSVSDGRSQDRILHRNQNWRARKSVSFKRCGCHRNSSCNMRLPWSWRSTFRISKVHEEELSGWYIFFQTWDGHELNMSIHEVNMIHATEHGHVPCNLILLVNQ